MSRDAYVDGVFMPLNRAGVSIQDRGFQFGDSIYEVWSVIDGRLLDEADHFKRLDRSLRELSIPRPMADASLRLVIRELMRRNRVRKGLVYLQISRGAATRDHAFPPAGTKPTLVITAKNLDQAAIDVRAATGIRVITLPENRWARCDIKSTNLLPNVLARQAAGEKGAFEAWFVDADGLVTEGTSSSAWIVDSDGALRTRELSNRILHGVTRGALLGVAKATGMRAVEKPFSVEEALSARAASA